MRALSRMLWLLSATLTLALPVSAPRAAPPVAEPFRAYYEQHHGMRVLGYPLTELIEVQGYEAQYFEKGRLEDHRADQAGQAWDIMLGRLTAELIEHARGSHVNGTYLTYAELGRYHDPTNRWPAPAGFASGTAPTPAGMFVPYDSQLRSAPGYLVPAYFWGYITRADLFPGGWLHDVGLPMTSAFTLKVGKGDQLRSITMQAFERTVLTYDPLNPPEWQIERGNIGADMVRTLPPANIIETPIDDARVTLPLHVLARVGRPGDTLTISLRWADGTRLIRNRPVSTGEDGRGVLIDSLDIAPERRDEQPWTQRASLEITDSRDALLARRQVEVLNPDDPDTRLIQLYWIVNGHMTAELRRVPKGGAIETTALEELLWGPGPHNNAGYTTALPTPEEVLKYPGRTADWGPRVTLRRVTIVDGVAFADFSQELRAYAGEALRASQIHAQITLTIGQFEQVQDVRITIEGERDPLLEPSG